MRFEGDRVILCHGVVDLRKGAAGLLALVEAPEVGAWYLFSNRRRTLIKCVKTDGRGNWVASRRLGRGHFHWIERAAGSSAIDVRDAEAVCNGDPIKRRPEAIS